MSNFKEQLLETQKLKKDSLLKKDELREKTRLEKIKYRIELEKRIEQITNAIEYKIKPLFTIFNNTLLDSKAIYTKQKFDQQASEETLQKKDDSELAMDIVGLGRSEVFCLKIDEYNYINVGVSITKNKEQSDEPESIKINLTTGQKNFSLEINSILEQDLIQVEEFIEECLLNINPETDMFHNPGW